MTVYRNAPRLLSEWGLFADDIRDQNPADGVLAYELRTPLFSDYTHKRRFVRLPEGRQMTYRDPDVFDFPAGTVIAKTFSCPHDMRDLSQGERLLETRIEQHTDTGWYGYTYLWNDDQTDAAFNVGGGATDTNWIHSDGKRRTGRYQFPNANQCISCHSTKGEFIPIGPTARNLNCLGQLQDWDKSGSLAGLPESGALPRFADFDEASTGTVADRARAWLDVNCAHCHNENGSARTSGLDLSWHQTDPVRFGVWKSPVATGRGSGGRRFDIVPGRPDESILMYRIESDEAGIRMPNLARSISHPESIALIRQWIESLPDDRADGTRP